MDVVVSSLGFSTEEIDGRPRSKPLREDCPGLFKQVQSGVEKFFELPKIQVMTGENLS